MSVLELRNIVKTFEGIKAVDNVSIGFDKGRITALIGPNGAGKTTIFNIISGFLRPDSGEIIFNEKNITGFSPWFIANVGICRLFQDVRVFGRMKVIDNVLCAFRNQSGEKFLYPIFLRWKIMKEENYNRDRALELLEFVGLKEKTDEFAENLSYGQQKLLAIARLLASGAEVFLLDEPTAGVNPTMVRKLLELIKRLKERGKTIIIIEHNMNVVIEIADWVYFIDAGQVISFGLPEDVLGSAEIRRTYIGI